MSAAVAVSPPATASSSLGAMRARPAVRKTLPHVWFPAGLLTVWSDLTKTEIVIDGVAREMCDRFERRMSAAKFAERAGVDPSDARRALRKLVQLGLQKRRGNMRDPGGYVVTPASPEEVSARFRDAMPLDFAVPAAVVRDWQSWSRLEILVFAAVCLHKEARRRGIDIAARVTSTWLALFLKQPARSCRQALRELARRGAIRREERHRWAPTPWAELAFAGDPTGRLATGSRLETAALTPGSNGKQPPELAAIAPPSMRQRRPCARGSVGPDRWGVTANGPLGSSAVRTLSTRGRVLPPRDPPPSLHPDVGREGDEHLVERHDSAGALVPLARAAAKAFSDRNGVVDVNHAARRLADVKARYGMSEKELEKYVRAAPDQPGLLRAGFPFGAAFSPGRLEPWLERHRHRRQSPPEHLERSTIKPLSARELATRGSMFLGSLARAPSARLRCGA